MILSPAVGVVTAAQFAITGSEVRPAALVIVAVLVVFVGARQFMNARNLKRRKAASVGYHDRDLARYGQGPVGFAGAASARTADSTPLAPTFGPGAVGSPVAPPAPTRPFHPLTPQVGPPAPVAAGWLPDPSGDPSALRYWDGTGWTAHTARRGA